MVGTFHVPRVGERHVPLAPVSQEYCGRELLQNRLSMVSRQASEPSAPPDRWIQIGNRFARREETVIVILELRVPEFALQGCSGLLISLIAFFGQRRIASHLGEIAHGVKCCDPFSSHCRILAESCEFYGTPSVFGNHWQSVGRIHDGETILIGLENVRPTLSHEFLIPREMVRVPHRNQVPETGIWMDVRIWILVEPVDERGALRDLIYRK